MTDRHPLLKFGIFTIVCLGFAAWIIAVVGNYSFDDFSRTDYAGVFTDASGLLVNDAVKISGVTVGKVTGIEVADGGKARVNFSLNDDIELGSETQLEIRWRDVFGLRFLYLHPAGEGDPLPAGHEFEEQDTIGPADLGLLLERITPFMRALDPDQQNQVLQALSEALVGRTQEVRDLVQRGASLTQAVAAREEEIGRVLENSATVLDAYARREADLRALIDRFAEVADTLAGRNDELESAVVTIADAQAELRRLLEANDAEIRATLDELDEITTVLSFNRDNLEDLATFSGRGIVAYHRISRLGQWFNIRAVGVSSDYEELSSERDGHLPERRTDASATSTSLARFFSGTLDLRGAG